MSYKKIHPPHSCHEGQNYYIDQNHFLYQAVNIFFSAVNLGILTWGVYGIDSLLEPASSGQSMNYSFSHFRVGFKRGSGRLPLGMNRMNRRQCVSARNCFIAALLQTTALHWSAGSAARVCSWVVLTSLSILSPYSLPAVTVYLNTVIFAYCNCTAHSYSA